MEQNIVFSRHKLDTVEHMLNCLGLHKEISICCWSDMHMSRNVDVSINPVFKRIFWLIPPTHDHNSASIMFDI